MLKEQSSLFKNETKQTKRLGKVDHTHQIFQNLRQRKKKRKFFFHLGGMSIRVS